MLVALWQFDREQLLAGLLLFRLLYYVTPFALALVVLGVREIFLGFVSFEAQTDPSQPAALNKAESCPGGATETETGTGR